LLWLGQALAGLATLGRVRCAQSAALEGVTSIQAVLKGRAPAATAAAGVPTAAALPWGADTTSELVHNTGVLWEAVYVTGTAQIADLHVGVHTVLAGCAVNSATLGVSRFQVSFSAQKAGAEREESKGGE
jgi:hypothetical protein